MKKKIMVPFAGASTSNKQAFLLILWSFPFASQIDEMNNIYMLVSLEMSMISARF